MPKDTDGVIRQEYDHGADYFTTIWASYSADCRGVTRSRATRSREIKLDDITRRVKNLSREISELSKLLFVACRGSNAPLIRLACQNLTKEKEKKKRRRRRGSRGSSHRQPEWRRKIPVLPSKMPPPLLNDLFCSILGTRRKLWMAVEWLIRHGQYQVVSDILGQTLFALFALCIDGDLVLQIILFTLEKNRII